MAISVAAFENCNYPVAAEFGKQLVSIVAKMGGLPPKTLLNVNVPSVERRDLAGGVSITRLGARGMERRLRQASRSQGG